MKIITFQSTYAPIWDAYVHAHPHSTLYHLSGWKTIIEKTYGHKTYYLMAINSSKLKAQSSKDNCITANQLTAHSSQLTASDLSAISYELEVIGILPLIHLKHFLFGNNLISIPFFDIGGILADDNETEKALLSEAVQLGQELKVDNIELRHIEPLSWLDNSSKLKAPRWNRNNGIPQGRQSSKSIPMSYQLTAMSWVFQTRSHKVRMLLDLPESSEMLMKSFKSKLRSQMKKPLKEGLKSKIGGLELLEDFYNVFSINMRDLGSPVHSKKLMQNVLEEFPEKAKIMIIYKDDQPLACSMVVGFKDTLENPWASALREYSRLSPNMLLYWSMLEYACDNGYAYFDFGRSSPDEGTYRFKEQWGARPTSLYWHYVALNGEPIGEDASDKSKFNKAIQFWQKLPVSVANTIGPLIRKHIGL